MKSKIISLGAVLASAPVLTLAASSCSGVNTGTLQYIICKIGEILNMVIPVLIILAIVWFIWGVVTFVVGNDEEAKKRGKDKMIYGIIGLAVIVTIWGLVGLLKNTLGLNDIDRDIEVPGLPYSN